MRPRFHSRPSAVRPAQRGAATLVVVMVLFFIVALVAAYTSRNLIFEQRTSANQYRSTQAFEAAEAGLEWALTMLNSGLIDAACKPHFDPATADKSFRDRYLNIDDNTGSVEVRTRTQNDATGQPLPLRPACVFDGTEGTGWTCSCPADGASALDEPAGPGPHPAFVLRFFKNVPAYPPGSGSYPAGVVRIESTGCTRLDAGGICTTAATSGDGRATVTILAALKSALTMPPYAALTAGGSVSGANLTVVNGNPAGPNISIHAGSDAPEPSSMPILIGPAGMPSADTRWSDAALTREALASVLLTRGDRLFASFFGMTPDVYRDQPASVHLDCGELPSTCTGDQLRSVVELNPGRIVWVKGNVDIDSDGDIGDRDAPTVLVLNGNLTFSAADTVNLYGAVYSRVDDWTIDGNGRIHGAVVAQRNVIGTGAPAIVYDPEVLERLRLTHGSFVRVPGSWRDF